MTTEYTELVKDIYAWIDEPDSWEHLATRLMHAIGGHAVALQYQPWNSNESFMRSIKGFTEEWCEDYLKRWAPINPWRIRGMKIAQANPARALDVAMHMSELSPPEEFRRTNIFNESFRQMDIYDCITLPLFAREKLMWFAIFCGRDKDTFNRQDFDLAMTLAPHITHAAIQIERFAALRRMTQSIDANPNHGPAFVLSHNGEILEASVDAIDQLMDNGVARKEGAALRLQNLSAHQRLQAELASVGMVATPLQYRLGTSEFEAAPGWKVLIARTPGLFSDQQQDARSPGHWFVEFQQTGNAAPTAARLSRKYKLTPSETDIAVMLADGVKTSEIAERRGNSLNTIRWHIKKIYAKMRVSSRAALVKKIMQLKTISMRQH